MRNKVVSGDFMGYEVNSFWGVVMLSSGTKGHEISKANVTSWQIVDGNSRTSATSAITRGAIGAFLLGPIGVAAALSAKKKGTYLIAIEFNDGKQCLVEVDEKMKGKLIKAMY